MPQKAMECLAFDHVLYVPAFQSPLKNQKPSADHHRLEMLKLALADCPWASISTIELERGETSYTIDTIESIQNDHEELRLLIGADQWAQFKNWHRWEDILRLANPAIMPREGFAICDERLLPIAKLQSMSTNIRKRVQEGNPIGDSVPPEVAEYITEHGLYL